MIEWKRLGNNEIDDVWDHCIELIKAACIYDGNKRDADSYYNDFTTGRKQLWIIYTNHKISALVVTCLLGLPLRKICSIEICTGVGIDDLIANVPCVEEWAREMGCDGMFLTCRPGFRRKLKDYKHTHDFLEKDL